MKFKTPPSLAQLFDAPADYIGEFGWIVGYSADSAFLNDAAERFSRKTSGQRAWEGIPRLALMLDSGNKQVAPVDAPGVAHLPLAVTRKPFRLLHAKVALLGFRHETHGEWKLRLLVSTGNWTRQTLEESLDLSWSVELYSANFMDERSKLDCADVQAAWGFLDFVRKLSDLRILGAPQQIVESWIVKLPPASALPKPRFFDNRRNSLASQLVDQVEAQAAATARNHISFGAGFYEAPSGQTVPVVLERISRDLTKAGLLTSRPEVAVFVNPLACQAVAHTASGITKRGWDIRPAGTPRFFPEMPLRALHAKFIFSASYRGNSNNCIKPWLYLGSGNMTAPGFTQAMSAHGGNLEAGVVFAPQRLSWAEEDGGEPANVLSNVLPVQWDQTIDQLDTLAAGGEMPERGEDFIAPPVAWLDWHESRNDAGGWLAIPDGTAQVAFDVMEGDGPCEMVGSKFLWQGLQPRQVDVSWAEGDLQRRAFIPVKDEHGRLASTKLPTLNHMDAWLQLQAFPMPPEDEEGGEENPPFGDGVSRTMPGIAAGPAASSSIREMMALIENIAQKQTSIAQVDWTAWLVRLEQTLFQMTDCPVLKSFKSLSLNPLSPLRHPEFRPSFAESVVDRDGAAYEQVLDRVEAKWETDTFSNLESVL